MNSSAFLRAIDYIEQNLAGNIDLNQAAGRGFTSLMQLYRDFYANTGHTVKEYIRKRRLSNALNRIRFTDASLADIAYECGFSSQQSLCRSVKTATGLTPLTFKNSNSIYYFPACRVKNGYYVSVSQDTIPPLTHWDYKDTSIKGIEERALAAFFQIFPGYRGRLFGCSREQTGHFFSYELSFEYHEGSHEDLLEKLKTCPSFSDSGTSPAETLTFARLSVRNQPPEIEQAWNYLYSVWLKTSMFEQYDKPYREEYILRNSTSRNLILYLPVQKKRELIKISLLDCREKTVLSLSRKGPSAEETASLEIINYFTLHYPGLPLSCQQYYISREENEYTCGIVLSVLPHDGCIEPFSPLSIPAGRYAVLEGGCLPDTGAFEEILGTWILENGFLPDDSLPIFTVYEACGSFHSKDIVTRIYGKISE